MKLYLGKGYGKRLLKQTTIPQRALRFRSESDAVFFAELVKRSGVKIESADLHVVCMSGLDKFNGEVQREAFLVGLVVNPEILNKPGRAIGSGESVSGLDWRDVIDVQGCLRYAMKYAEKDMLSEEVAA